MVSASTNEAVEGYVYDVAPAVETWHVRVSVTPVTGSGGFWLTLGLNSVQVTLGHLGHRLLQLEFGQWKMAV